MTPDDCEKNLERLSMKTLPAQWRDEILRKARAAQAAPEIHPEPVGFRWQELLWPYPKAWAGLAVAWIVILVFHLATRHASNGFPSKNDVAQESIKRSLWQEQTQLAEWLVQFSPPVAEPPKRVPPGTHGVVEKNYATAV